MIGTKIRALQDRWKDAPRLRAALVLVLALGGTVGYGVFLHRKDYQRIADNRAFFGDFDPFGDFDLLFGAARLNMKIIDLPVRYRARTYGDTKISRFTHGFLLLKMTVFGFRKLRMGL